jgi:hypothetical protein
MKTKEEIMQEVLSAMTPAQLEAMFPPIERKNFVVRKNWYGRNQVITFVNNKNQKMTYNHDEVLDQMRPTLEIQECWKKRGYWSQSTNMPMITRHLATIEEL